MKDYQDSIDALKDIRSMMERSSRFISLSGLGGVFSGVFALLGAYAAHWKTTTSNWLVRSQHTDFGTGEIIQIDWSVVGFLVTDFLLVLLLSILVSVYFTCKKAKKNNQPLWGPHSRQLLLNLSIPLLTGGIFCVILFHQGLIALIAPTTLIFYGLALINSGKYSFQEVSYLGISEIFIGLLGLIFKGQGLIFWGIGFGLLHIVYGILMYMRHDR
jgi:hypothetical protein